MALSGGYIVPPTTVVPFMVRRCPQMRPHGMLALPAQPGAASHACRLSRRPAPPSSRRRAPRQAALGTNEQLPITVWLQDGVDLEPPSAKAAAAPSPAPEGTPADSGSSGSKVGIIVGATVGGTLVLLAAGTLVYFKWWRPKRGVVADASAVAREPAAAQASGGGARSCDKQQPAKSALDRVRQFLSHSDTASQVGWEEGWWVEAERAGSRGLGRAGQAGRHLSLAARLHASRNPVQSSGPSPPPSVA